MTPRDGIAQPTRLEPVVNLKTGTSATSIVPIVSVVSDDPVQAGVVASLARPGGNVTGLTFLL